MVSAEIGFTGTRKGLTEAQVVMLRKVFAEYDPGTSEFHHGDCVGADVQAAYLARLMGFCVVGHPPLNPNQRAFFPSDMAKKPKPYLARNKDIVDEVDVMVACPGQEREIRRSGTWATVRYAGKVSRKTQIIYPSGRWEGRHDG